ncbi:Uncharacterised protein [Mycobacteroides abscessus subsp. abscessus]|nr:Uncharacterised protein [Mycobacteroides abscessus subsp. abscessus]SKT61833.1 Uncharacterised protein [Mycobacteroides abscessus subsp. abscessus]
MRGWAAAINACTSVHTCCSSRQYRSRYSRSPKSRSTGGSPAKGLARTAASQSSAAGHGSEGISTCAATARKSTHTDPPRSARTASAIASSTDSSVSDANAVSRCATCTSAGSRISPNASTKLMTAAPTARPPAPRAAAS